MTREERLEKIARDLFAVSEEDKANKKEREDLKEEFFRLLEKGFQGRNHILPVKTIEVPDTFWDATGMSKEEFVETRFPGWNVQHVEKNLATKQTVFVLQRDPKFIPSVVETEADDVRIKVGKEVAEYTPEIDWDTLFKERPDLWRKLARPVITLELDDTELEKIAMEEPQELATLERHMKVKTPSLRIQPRKLKDAK